MHRSLPWIMLLGLLGACTSVPRERFVLLPDADGSVGQITLQTTQGEATLARAYATADSMSDGRVRTGEASADEIRQRFEATLAVRPPAPVSFNVFFVFDKDELTAESVAQFDRIKKELAARPAPEIVVIGHTDRVGALEYNDALSLKRAETVRSALVDAGIRREQIEIAGRGEREPAVPTADEVAEPRNRRVEIMVR